MIVDTKGTPITPKSPREQSCPECGAPKENMHPTLGGWVTCMKCGYQTREIKSVKKTTGR